MRLLKDFIKNLLAIYHARQFESTLKSGKLNGQLLIIMYHRVLPKTDARLQNEEPGMYVTPDTLDMHLTELKRFAKLIHIEDWLQLANNNQLEDTLYCAITFDDGWADNYEFAWPLLKKHDAPATIYLATDYIGSTTTFWPERLAALLNNFQHCEHALSEFFKPLGETLDKNKLKARDKDYFAHLINVAKALTDGEIKQQLNELEAKAQINKQTEMLSWEQVKELQEAGVRIGGHTRSHLRLNDKASPEQIEHEVVGCAQDIEAKLGKQPTQFCYPNGDTSEQAINKIKSLFNVAVTTQSGINQKGQAPHLLKRAGVHEDAAHTATKLRARLAKASS